VGKKDIEKYEGNSAKRSLLKGEGGRGSGGFQKSAKKAGLKAKKEAIPWYSRKEELLYQNHLAFKIQKKGEAEGLGRLIQYNLDSQKAHKRSQRKVNVV